MWRESQSPDLSAAIDLPIREVTNHAGSPYIALEILLLQCYSPKAVSQAALSTPEESFFLLTPNGNLAGKTKDNFTIILHRSFPTP